MDTSLCKGFEAISQALKAVALASIMARAVISWADDLAKVSLNCSKGLSIVIKIFLWHLPLWLMPPWVQFRSPRAMAGQVVTCRNVGLGTGIKGILPQLPGWPFYPSKGKNYSVNPSILI